MSAPQPEDGRLHVADVSELVSHAQLVDVVTHRHHAERSEGAFADMAHGEAAPPLIFLRRADDVLDVRLDTSITCNDDVRLDVAVSAVYRFDTPVAYDQEILSQFITRVAVMAVYPFVREGLVDLAARMRVTPPVLPLLRQGQVDLNPVAEPQTANT